MEIRKLADFPYNIDMFGLYPTDRPFFFFVAEIYGPNIIKIPVYASLVLCENKFVLSVRVLRDR